MNDKFVTEAIIEDRCLKAYQLINRFEDEMEDEIRRWGKNIIETNPELFSDDPDRGFTFLWEGNVIANAYDNLTLNSVNKETEKQLNLNISLRWVDPSFWGEDDVDGALCAACYKLNGGHRDSVEEVKEATDLTKWGLNFGDDQTGNAEGILYIPVESAEDFRSAMDTLTDHFTEFGDYWGEDPNDDAAEGASS